MRLSALNILQINITNSPKKEILEEIEKGLVLDGKKRKKTDLKSGKMLTIVTPNPEQIVLAQREKAFQEVLNRADVALPDGDGVVWASHVLHPANRNGNIRPIEETIHGVDFMENLIVLATKQRVPVALIGGFGDVAVRALECLQAQYPSLTGVGIQVPDISVKDGVLKIDRQNNPDEYFSSVARRIADKGIKMVFIALGAPKQEYYMEALKRKVEKLVREPVILMVVGGSLDILSGMTPRAPRVFLTMKVPLFGGKVRLEWLWRLFREPTRIKRQLALLTFIRLVLQTRFVSK